MGNMPASQSLRVALASAGYQLIDAPDTPRGAAGCVVDAEGMEWLCTLADACSSREWDAAQEAAAELTSGRHRHVVGLHDVVALGDEVEEGDGECGSGDATGRISRVLIWAAGSPAQRLGDFRTHHQLDLGQISAALVAAGRGLASLDSLGLPAPAQWTLDDLVLQPDGTLQLRPDGIAADSDTNASEQLRRVARNGQVLLNDVDGDQRSPDLAHLLTATTFDDRPVGPGTFAALCHELVTPADAGSWLLSPDNSQEPGFCLESDDGAEADATGARAAGGREDAANYSDLTHNWRNYVRTGTRSGQITAKQRRFGLAVPTWASAMRNSPMGRHKADRTTSQHWHKRRGVLATIGVGVLIAGLGTQMILGGSGTEPVAETTPRGAPVVGDQAPAATIEPTPGQQKHGQPQDESEGQARRGPSSDPDAAAMELTEQRLRILQELRSEQSAQSDTDSLEQRLAAVLVPKSPAMNADLSLVSDLAESTGSTENVFAEARTARTLRQDDETAVVEVSYDLVDPDAGSDTGTVAQSATLTLTLVDDRWLVNAVSDVPPTEPQL